MRGWDEITLRQREVLLLVAKGWSNETIGGLLSISPATVKFHLSGIYQYLGVTTRAAALWRALELGIIEPPARPEQKERAMLFRSTRTETCRHGTRPWNYCVACDELVRQ